MKLVIMAGGYGTRIGEETKIKPKPMVEIGGKPILWHIMKWYEKYNITEFIICCGYKGHVIKKYFLEYAYINSNLSIKIENGIIENYYKKPEPWKVTLINTGKDTMTAGRLLQVKKYLADQTFLFTYGDGVSDVNIEDLVKFHKSHKKTVTMSTIQPEGRFGTIKINNKTNEINAFKEKSRNEQSWINIGFMVMEPQIFNYLGNGNSMLEQKPFEILANNGEMAAYCHKGFWSPMDTIHDRDYLEGLWKSGRAPWKYV